MSAEYRRLKFRTSKWVAAGLVGLPILASCSDESKESTDQVQSEVHLLDLFELEGDVDNDVQPGDDWNNVFGAGSGAFTTSGPSSDGPNHSIFTQGSKDLDNVSGWHWGEGSAPDKDELITAYAAAYMDGDDLIAYFGADRFSVDGDAQIGFWFFKNKIGLNGDGTFSGVHAIGDMLVLSDFTNGGTIGTIGIYEWAQIGTKGNKAIFGPKFIAGGVPAADQNNTHVFCLSGGATDDLACGTINSATFDPVWPYTAKGGSSLVPPGGFFEGGINLSDLVPGNTCFSSFMAETRSSQELSATLKDFVLDDFETCGISVVKTCSETVVNEPGSEFQFTSTWSAVVSNTGAGDLPNGTVISVQDDNGTPGDTTDDPPAQTCTIGDPGIAGPEDCTFGGTIQTDTNGVTNTVTATATTNGTTLTATSSDTCPIAPLSATLVSCKACETKLEVIDDNVVVRVDFNGKVCNAADSDLPLQLVGTDQPGDGQTAADIVFDGFGADDFLDPGSCVTYSASYYPMASSENPLDAGYTDTVSVDGFHPAIPGGPVTSTSASADCDLCAAGGSCADFPPPEGGAGGASGN
jgi:hypothetical protein